MQFSLNFTQMFLSVRLCAEQMPWLHRLKVKVTLQSHWIFPSTLVRSISPEPLRRFSLNSTQMFLSVRQCAKHMTQPPRLMFKVTGQGHVSYTSICVPSISPESFEGFSLKFTQMFLSVRWCAEPMTQLPRLKVKGQGQGIYP